MYIQFLVEWMLVEVWGWGYLLCLLVVLVLCSVILIWDVFFFVLYCEYYVFKVYYYGVDVFIEVFYLFVGFEQFMEYFYVCYGRDGWKMYFKKQD